MKLIAPALLAIVLDALIGLIERGLERGRRVFVVVASIGLAVLGASGLYPLLRAPVDVNIGAKSFTEQFIVAEILRNRLKEEGYTARVTRGMGSSILFESLAAGNTDVYVDYTGTIWSNVLKRTDILDAEATYEAVVDHLQTHYGIQTVGRLGFENAYALAMRRDVAQRLNIRSIADLAVHAPTLTIAGDYEFFGRPEWASVERSYGLRFSAIRGMDSSLMYSAIRDGQVGVISAFSTDGRIAAYDLVVLKDPANALPPYDAIVLVSAKAAEKGLIIPALEPLVGSITDDRMRQLNKLVDVDGKLPVEAARVP